MNNHSFFGVTRFKPTPFKVFECKSQKEIVSALNQRGLYKICLITGNSIIRYTNKEIETEGTYLLLGHADTTCNWDLISGEQSGYACMITKNFLNMYDHLHVLQQSGLFITTSLPVYSLNRMQKLFITPIFHRMMSEQSTEYNYKAELIHNLVSLILHEALKMRTTSRFFTENEYCEL